MGQVTNRTGLTSHGFVGLSPWSDSKYTYSVLQINLGSNFIAKLEIVSALNSFNLALQMYHFNYVNCTSKYNPKLYLGAFQTTSENWDLDYQDPTKVDQKWAGSGNQKSGS